MSLGSELADQSAVDAFLAAVIARRAWHCRSFVDVAREGFGAFPTDVRRVLERLMSSSISGLPSALRNYEPNFRPILEAASSRLPLPHPLDYEWRFSVRGCTTFADAVSDAAPGPAVGLMGTPALAEVLPSLLSDARFTLFELRPEACAAFVDDSRVRVVEGDVRVTELAHRNSFDVLVADPPWYPEPTDGFLRAAAELLRSGGVLLLCAPGLATRPGQPAERNRSLASAASLGFVLEHLRHGAIEYEAPPFELSALGAAGLPGFDPYWRTGDLLAFTLVRGSRSAAPTSDKGVIVTSHWEEVVFGRARIRVNLLLADNHAGQLDPIVTGDVLDSVSARDARREIANVWTGMNRVFRTCDPHGLIRALRALRDGRRVAPGWDEPLARLIEPELGLLERLGLG